VSSKLTDRLAAWVLDTPRWKFLSALFVLMFLRTGVTPVAPALVRLAKDPYTLPWTDPYQHYLFWSWLGPFLAHLVHATTKPMFTLFYLAFSLGFTALMVRWMFTRLDESRARVAVLIFALLPASATSYYWIWTDSLTLFLLACTLYFPRGYPVLVMLGVGLGMQHFEQASFAAAAALFALAWAQWRGHRGAYGWAWAASILVGAIIGKAVLIAVFAHYDIHVNSGRFFWLAEMWPVLLKRFAYTFHASVFATFAVGWFVMVSFLRRAHPATRPTAVALFGLMLLLPISDDPTRVYAIVSFLVVCAFVLSDAEFLATIDRPTVGRLALAWLVVPWVFVWAGKAMVSATGYNVLATFDTLFHTSGVFQDPRVPF
jgi:hypothetical protein